MQRGLTGVTLDSGGLLPLRRLADAACHSPSEPLFKEDSFFTNVNSVSGFFVFVNRYVKNGLQLLKIALVLRCVASVAVSARIARYDK